MFEHVTTWGQDLDRDVEDDRGATCSGNIQCERIPFFRKKNKNGSRGYLNSKYLD